MELATVRMPLNNKHSALAKAIETMGRSISDEAARHVVIDRDDDIYQAYVDVALTRSGKLVCVWRETAAHAEGEWARLVMKHSLDLGRTWSDRILLADSSKILWLLSNILCLRDGRLVINACSVGGESYLFWSEDDGETWSEPREIDVEGIAPRRPVELPNGTLLQSLSQEFPRKNHWRNNNRTVVYQSTDGDAWSFLSVAAESDILAPCEAPIVQLHDGTLVCYYRENSCLHHPTLKNYSYDNGRTWTEPEVTGLYAFQPNASVLTDSRVLFTYCNVGGNCGACAWCGDGYDSTAAQASARWKDDGCVTLLDDSLRIKTTGDPESRPPFFLLLPAENDKSTIIFEARLKCMENATGDACIINIIEAGELRFYHDRVELVHEPVPEKPGRDFSWGRDIKVAESFKVDATEFHTYRIVRSPERILTVSVDNVPRLRTANLMKTRPVPYGAPMHDLNCFGTSPHIPGQFHLRSPVVPQKTRGESYWQFVKLRVTNPTLPEYQYSWQASSGRYPNQYERDHILEIAYDPRGDPGEPHTIELPDGRIYCVYHTAATLEKGRNPSHNPYIMGCYIHLCDLSSRSHA